MLDHAAFWVIVGLACFALGYRFYGRFVSNRLFDCEDDSPTPATTLNDGVDYVPTSRHVLLGHHFTSVAGAAPIVGPAVACIHGWVPALLWIVLGVIFIGAVHDLGALVVSVRNQGKSLGDIAGDLVGPRARVLFLLLIVILTWLVLAAFASIIGTLFHAFPASVLPINIEIPIAVAIGWWYHKRRGGILIPSLIALVVMWGSVFLTANNEALQWQIPETFATSVGLTQVQVWVVILLAYSFCTCILPVWVLLQPRDFINSHQLFVGLAVIYLAIFVGNPLITAPAINDAAPDALFPVLFITIACGAVSGFHSLVASGTTSKQITTLRHARSIGYGSMIGEGALAMAATMAVAAGFTAADWKLAYAPDGGFRGAGIGNFVKGASNLLVNALGDSADDPAAVGALARTIIAVIVISFAATTLDTACRIQRFCLGELARPNWLAWLRNRYVAAGIAAGTPLLLVLETGDHVPAWRSVWPVFGASNQMLGAIALLLITIYLNRRGKPVWYTGLPAVFLTVITATGLVGIIRAQLAAASVAWAVLLPAVLLLLLAVAVLWEGVLALTKPVAADAA